MDAGRRTNQDAQGLEGRGDQVSVGKFLSRLGPFDVVSSADEADDHFEYLGPDNKPVYVYLRRTHEKNTIEEDEE
jgi:hypothetical protein